MTHVPGWWRVQKLIDGLATRNTDPVEQHLIDFEGAHPRNTPGEFDTAYGRLRFADAASALAQYRDIFLRKCYAFTAEGERPVVIDCGANIGLASLWIAKNYPQAKITAFEADPSLAGILSSNIGQINHPDVTVIQAAVWNEAGSMPFFNSGDDRGHVDVGSGPQATITVPAVRLADFVTGQVDLLKIDIEGAEFTVIPDLLKAGALAFVRRMVCELHIDPENWGAAATLLRDLAAEGFRMTVAEAYPGAGLLGGKQPTPFPFVADGRSLIQLYAWR